MSESKELQWIKQYREDHCCSLMQAARAYKKMRLLNQLRHSHTVKALVPIIREIIERWEP